MSGNVQELAVKHVAIEDYSKSIVIYVAGRAASTCKRKGHANTISMGEMGPVESKVEAFEKATIQVTKKHIDVPKLPSENLVKPRS